MTSFWRCIMDKRYGQILRTYTGRWAFWTIVLFALLWFGLQFLMMHSAKMWAASHAGTREAATAVMEQFVFCFMAICYYVGFVVVHLKQQMASPRASLMPRYRQSHLAVATAMIVPVMIAVAVTSSVTYHIPLLPLLGLVLAFCSLVAWAVYMGNMLFMVVAACWLLPQFSVGAREFVGRLLAGEMAPLAWALLTSGVVAFIALGRRLLLLSEEMVEYHRGGNMGNMDVMRNLRGEPAKLPADSQNRWFTNFFLSPGNREMAWLNRPKQFTFWRRVRRWGIGGGNLWGGVLMGVLIAIMALGMAIFMKGGDLQMLWISFVTPAFFVGGAVIRRRWMIGYEIMRPVERRAFLVEQATAMSIWAGRAWLASVITIVAGFALWNRSLLAERTLWFEIFGSALLQIIFLSCIFWISRIRRTYGLLILSAAFAAPSGMVALNAAAKLTPSQMAIAGGVALVASVLILWDAYRRWMVTDLG
jgi:hypothetical protein